jgi:SAM-dependent methyltransferase
VPIDFHAAANRLSYAGRRADATWLAAMRDIVDPAGLDVVDIGCGGGTYSLAWMDLGARSVTGVDFSAEMVGAARDAAQGRAGLTFRQADAAATGLPDASADVVFARALVHHVADLAAVVREAARLLRPAGTYIVQDRVADDVRQPGSAHHPRGWFFERFPALLDVELARRPGREKLAALLRDAGLADVTTRTLWEVRRAYPSREEYLDDVRSRTGRSILHELSDDELAELVADLARRLPAGAVTETDRWTVWHARRP